MSGPAPDYARLRQAMVDRQLVARGIADRRVLDAMGDVARHQFVAPQWQSHAYEDRALPIACGQTISQPYIVALMTEALGLAGDESVLEIGAGCGYQTVILSRLAKRVVALERHPALARTAEARVKQHGCENVEVHTADGWLGWPSGAPYDALLAAAAATEIPRAWIDQLRVGGRLVAPLGERLVLIHRDREAQRREYLTAVRFVPLLRDVARDDAPH